MDNKDQKQSTCNSNQAESFLNAFKGIGHTIAGELHMKVHLCFAIAALIACALLRVEPWGWCVVILCIGLVFGGEIINTSLESLCDKVSPEFDPFIKVAKDAAAGAVLVFAITAVVAGLIVFVNPLLHLLGM